MKFAWDRIVVMTAGSAAGVVWVCMGPAPPEFEYAEPLRIQALALSVLFAFLMGFVTVLGDREALLTANRRTATRHADQVVRAITGYTVIFYLYLSVILFTFFTLAVAGRVDEEAHGWLVHIALGGGGIAIIWSFGIPVSIRREYKDRLEDRVRDTPR